MWPSPTPNKGAVGQMSSPKKNRIDNVLRQGERQVAGIRAIESIRSALPKEAGEQEKLSLSLLTVQAVRPAPGELHRILQMSLKTGEAGPEGDDQAPSLSKQDAVALWDAMVKSFRLRSASQGGG